MTKPTLFITAGDPMGIGPEVLVKALKDGRVRRLCTPVIIGEQETLKKAGWNEDLAQLIPMDSPAPKPTQIGPSQWGGEISFKSLQLACKLAARHKAAVVTAPVSKQSWTLAKVPFAGHTEFLREHYGQTALMMFVSGKLRCALASEHFAIANLTHVLTKSRIIKAGKDFHQALKQLGTPAPHMAVSALNPHAGDNGKFGQEENKIIAPAIKALRQAGIKTDGPFPIDALWDKHTQGKFDGILCMYHDQALLGLKLASKEPVVHIAAGLDFLRVSPTHGTAFDIAGKNQANPASMLAALLFAAKSK